MRPSEKHQVRVVILLCYVRSCRITLLLSRSPRVTSYLLICRVTLLLTFLQGHTAPYILVGSHSHLLTPTPHPPPPSHKSYPHLLSCRFTSLVGVTLFLVFIKSHTVTWNHILTLSRVTILLSSSITLLFVPHYYCQVGSHCYLESHSDCDSK